MERFKIIGGVGKDAGVGGNIENGMGAGESWNGNWSGLGVDKLEDKVICKTKAGQLHVLENDGAVILRPTRRSRAAEMNTLLFSSPALER